MYESLPQELKEYPYFCGWQYEIVKVNRIKVPKRIKGHNADTRNLSEFSTLLKVLEQIGSLDGIGIALAGDIAAIDIDHYIKDEKLSEMVGDIITLAAITGSIAEAAYGIPDWIKEKAYSYLDEPLKDVLRRWDNKVDVK